VNSQWLNSLIDILTNQTMPPVEAAERVLAFGTVHPDGCMDVALINKNTGEIREQSVWCAERWPRRWREGAARRMRTLEDGFLTPQRIIGDTCPDKRKPGYDPSRANRIAVGEPAIGKESR
jgi:hypothetical protein